MNENSSKPKISIYVVGHKQFDMPVKSSIYIPLMVGNQYEELPEGWLSDSTGENISGKNPRYNELTGFYWIWKNSNADIVGVCHYRRYFITPVGKIKNVMTGKKSKFITENYIKKSLSSHDVILHNKTFIPGGNLEQLCVKKNDSKECEKSRLSREILDVMNHSFQKLYPEDYVTYKKVMNGRYAHLLNIVVCYKEIFNQYCEWLFPLLYDMEKEIDRQFPERKHERCMGLIAERLLDVWVLKKSLRIKECFTVNTERIDWKPW